MMLSFSYSAYESITHFRNPEEGLKQCPPLQVLMAGPMYMALVIAGFIETLSRAFFAFCFFPLIGKLNKEAPLKMYLTRHLLGGMMESITASILSLACVFENYQYQPIDIEVMKSHFFENITFTDYSDGKKNP